MSFNVYSAILRGKWLLDKQWATSHFPLVMQLLEGKTVDFGNRKAYNDDADGEDERTPEEKAGIRLMAGKTNVYQVRPFSKLNELPFDSIAVLNIAGPLMKRGGMCSYGMVDHTDLINRLANADNVSGIILSIDSPGGQADGTASFADAIKNAGTKKPVIAVIEDGMAASAAMWIASAANEIYVTQKTDQVGSIGVYTTIADWNAYYANEGLPVKDIYAPQSTDKNRGYNEALQGNEDMIKEELRVLADQFINTVATNRKGKLTNDSWKTSSMFYANDAIKIGLIDGIKSFDQVVNRLNTIKSSRQKSNSNTMAFEKTLAAAKATEFTVTDEGFVMSEEQLNNIEAHLISLEPAQTAAAELIAANETIGQLNGTITERDNAITALQTAATGHQQTISELQAEVKRLGGAPSGNGTQLPIAADEKPSEIKMSTHLRYDDPEHPANKAAARFVRKKN